MKKIAINGFGRIGRLTLRAILNHDNIKVAGINDLFDSTTLAHLFKYDSTYGPFKGKVLSDDTSIIINDKKIPVFKSLNPLELPWNKLQVDIVIDATGRFLDVEGASKHIIAGAKKVILSAPAKDPKIPTVVIGVNESILTTNPTIVSNASCTTNCLAPLVKILDDHFGIEQGTMNTIHAYTMDQSLQDAPHKDLRRARAAAMSIIPTSTGAAKAIGIVIPHLKGKLDGMAMRVPVVNGSIVDFTAILKKETTKEQINQVMFQAAQGNLKHILSYTKEPIVSIDIINSTYSSIFDANLTYANGKLIRIASWYDNENGYANRLADLVHLL